MPDTAPYLEGESLDARDVRALIDRQLEEAGLLDAAQPTAFTAGEDNVNFPTAAVSDEVAVVHGLGVTPRVFLQLVDPASTAPCGSYVRAANEHQFICRFETSGGAALTGKRLFYWMAIA